MGDGGVPTDDMAAGPALRARRIATGLTIDALAARSGVSPRTIGAIEREHIRRPHPPTLAAIAGALGLESAARARLDATLRAASPALDGACALPWPAPQFTGRAGDVAWLSETVRAGNTALLYGLAGVGKTALAVHAAAAMAGRFPDGIRFVDLANAAQPAVIARRLLESLGAAAADVLAGDLGVLDALRATLSRRGVLLVFDDARDPAQLDALRPQRDARASAIVTAGKRFPKITARPVPPLPAAEARLALARMLEGGGRAPGLPEVAELADLCGGVPLALRIAANRLLTRPDATVSGMVERLRRPGCRLDALVAGDLSVAVAFSAAHGRLSRAARAALHRLASAPALAAISDPPMELLDHGWLVKLTGGGFELPDLVREFAAARSVS